MVVGNRFEIKLHVVCFSRKVQKTYRGLAIRFSSFDDVQHLSELIL